MKRDTTIPNNPIDLDLQRRVTSFLASRWSPAPLVVQVEAHQGQVILRGRVASPYERQLLHSSARRVAGVTRVVDSLDVPHQQRRTPGDGSRFTFSPALSSYLARRRAERQLHTETAS